MAVVTGSGKADRVYQAIKSDIESGRFTSGQALSEVMLVAHTGASRTPVREAVRRLAAEGLVDLEPRKTPSVARISLRSVRALFDFRRLLEPAAIRLVVERARGASEIRERFAALQVRCENLVERASESSEFMAGFLEATADFDAELVRSTPNEYLARAIAELRPQTARLRSIAHEEHSRRGESLHEHAEMCSAIVSGDSERAAAGCTSHLFHVEQAIFRSLLRADGADRAGGDVGI